MSTLSTITCVQAQSTLMFRKLLQSYRRQPTTTVFTEGIVFPMTNDKLIFLCKVQSVPLSYVAESCVKLESSFPQESSVRTDTARPTLNQTTATIRQTVTRNRKKIMYKVYKESVLSEMGLQKCNIPLARSDIVKSTTDDR